MKTETETPSAAVAGTQVMDLPLKQLRESPLNSRKTFDAAKLQELAESIRTKGVLTPLLVRPRHDADTTPEIFEILAGARRSRAAKLAGVEAVPCVVREVDDATALEIITVENLQREDLAPLEEAEGYKQLLDVAKYDIATLAKRVGKSPSYIYQRVKLTELVGDAKKALNDGGKLTAGHAILIARLQPADQGRALKEMTRDRYNGPMSVRDLGDWIKREINLDLGKVPWKLDDAKPWPKAGACNDCEKRDLAACLDPACYEMKTREHFAALEAKLGSAGASVVLISTEYHATGRGLASKDWKKVKPKSCPDAQIGLAVDDGWSQGGELKRGQNIAVCANRKCKVHWKGEMKAAVARSGESKAQIERRKKEEQKREAQELIDAAVLNAVAEAAAKRPMPAFVLGDLAAMQSSNLYGDRVKAFLLRHGLKKMPKADGFAALPWGALVSCVLDLTLEDLADYDGKALQRYAKFYNVDVAKVAKAAQSKPAAAIDAKLQTSAKGKKAKGKRAA